MYFEQSEITNELECPQCKEQYDSPRMLPCGETICETCSKSLTVKKEEFKCPLCNEIHESPKNGSFPINKVILNLLKKAPKKIFRGEILETFDVKLKQLQSKINEFEKDLSNGTDKVVEYYSDLKNEIQLASELAIEQIKDINVKLIYQIELFEKECIENYKKNKDEKLNLTNEIKKTNEFVNKCKHNLNKSEFNENQIKIDTKECEQMQKRLEDLQSDFNDFIFNFKQITFEKNLLKIDVLGTFKITELISSKTKNIQGKEKSQQNEKGFLFSSNTNKTSNSKIFY
jgi:hypothetical protein